MFYLLLLPVLLIQVFYIIKFLQLRKHDKYLFDLCQLRREVLAYLRKNYKTITKTDYRAMRELIDGLELVIHNYNDYKTVIFNYRRFVKYTKKTESATKSSQITTKNKTILKFRQQFTHIVIGTFFAYTPLLRSEIITKVLLNVFGKYLRKRSNEFYKSLLLTKEFRLRY